MREVNAGFHVWVRLGIAACLVTVLPAVGVAQGIRGTMFTTARYLELRPIEQQTVPRALVTEQPDGRLAFEGIPVFCEGTDVCTFYRSLPVADAVMLTQDVDFTAWGLGMQGLSATVLLRARAQLAGDFVPPRAEEPFDAVLAYAELVRDQYRLRLGRQRNLSGLGFLGFDGLDVLVEPLPWLRVQGYGGRGLARGVYQPRSRALQGLDDREFVMDQNAYLFGAEVAALNAAGSSVALRYQSEIWGDRSGLLSERALLTARTAELRPVILSAAADWDFAFGRVGKAHLQAQHPLPQQRVMLEATARRYVPFFEYWTIWGFFSPVAYHEGELRASWSPVPQAGVWASAGHRVYAPTHAGIFIRPVEDRSWRLGVGGRWQVAPELILDGAYRLEGPVGAFGVSGDAAVTWQPLGWLGLSGHALVLQQIEEFRVGSGIVLGGGFALNAELLPNLHLTGGLDLYQQTQENRPGEADWTQRRGWLGLQLGFGTDPGVRGELEQ